MLLNLPYYPIPTGYYNATGSINFDINQLVNFDFISINNSLIYYNTDTTSSEFFNSTGSLIENVNNNSELYNVKLNLQNTKIFIESLISGEDGNNIFINSNNSGITFSDIKLNGGKNFYSILKKPRYPLNRRDINLTSPLFSADFSNKFFITGFYSGFASTAYLTGFINSFSGVRDFKNIWNIATGLVIRKDLIDFKFNNLFSGNSYYSNNTFNSKIPINVQISYNDVFSLGAFDVAELHIKDLNAPTPRLLSGIIFRITGLA